MIDHLLGHTEKEMIFRESSYNKLKRKKGNRTQKPQIVSGQKALDDLPCGLLYLNFLFAGSLLTAVLYALLKPAADLDDLEQVFIITEFENQ